MSDRFYIQQQGLQAKYFGKGHSVLPTKTHIRSENKQDVIKDIETILGEIPGIAKMTKAGLESVRYCIGSAIELDPIPDSKRRPDFIIWLKPCGIDGLKNLTIAGMRALGMAIIRINDVKNEEKECSSQEGQRKEPSS